MKERTKRESILTAAILIVEVINILASHNR
jgi:hypothetical protein